MPIEVRIPEIGESIQEGVIARWLKKNGDLVRRDEPLLELETEKATTEMPAPATGILVISVPEGKTVRVGATIATIEEKNVPAAQPPAREKPAAAKPAEAAAKPEPVKAAAKPEPGKPTAKPAAATTTDGRPAPALSPAARVMVQEKGIDPSELTPSGRGGVIVKEDVLAHETGKPAPAVVLPETGGRPAPEHETRERMTAVRKRIAERLLQSRQSTATLTTFNEADMSAVMELRAQYKEKFEKKHGVGLGFMAFFVKACVEAIRAFPVAQSRIDGEEIVTPHYYDFGVAVSTDRGLMVPVIRGCDQLSFAEIEKQIADRAKRAREGKIRPDDLAGGTFTITNGGVFGSLMSTPILNPPQSAILGMHAIQKRPVVLNDEIVIRPMMYLALSYDHRLIDGREAVLFLVRVKECIEHPERLLLEV
ncbi:MAG TPA: 2-oxoglutarate dehydrogenase complex dihydrolipoyllysine-residue succinyltransferase [Gemmataceae bacterium]|nr:2-oxoglutarate dehydrogenase complex dihydrolipoyllysine-residue succinyltransferase [Gemmataceae bacterium]